MSTTPRRSKGSHGPVIALLVGIALVVVASCGGAFYLISTSIAGMARMIDERNGPREHTEEGLRVRVRLPEGESWELLSGELARSWDPTGVVIVRSDECAAGLIAEPGSATVSLERQLASFYGPDARTEGGPTIAGLASPTLRVVSADDASTVAIGFLHELVLYRLIGDGPCMDTLVGATTVLPGTVTRGWPGASITDGDRRTHRVRAGIFESAASGLVVESAPGLSFVSDGVTEINASAEVVVLHADGARISLDPFRRPPGSPADDSRADVGIEVEIEGAPIRFRRMESSRQEVVGYAHIGELDVGVVADGPDLDTIRAGLVALAPHVRHLGPGSLELLRTELAQGAERRAGLDWSLRDRVFREHPQEARAAAVVYLPPWTELVAGRDLARRDESSRVVGEIASLLRRELGVAGRVVVAAATAPTATEQLDAMVTSMGASQPIERLGPVQTSPTGRARLELRVGAGSQSPERMTLVTELHGAFEYSLELWWREPEHPDAARFVEEVVRGFVVEPPAAEQAPSTPDRHVDERLGSVLLAPGGEISTEPPGVYAAYTDALAVHCDDGDRQSLCLIAASEPSASAALLDAVDQIGADRSTAAIWALPATPTTLDDRPATERFFWDGGREVRVVTTSIDRTVYVAVARGGPRTDWRSVFDRIDLDP